MDEYHKSVLLQEVVQYLNIQPGKNYIDATLGGGGHAQAILSFGGRVLGIDMDQEALDFVKTRLESEIENSRLVLTKGNFADIKGIALLQGFKKIAGIVFDLGVSSHQIDTGERGFSFLREGPLDMRMDKESELSAEYLVNLLGKGELYELFNRLGQESRSRAISNSIVSTRRIKAIKTTGELLEAIKRAYGIKGELSDYQKNMIGQKVFQALRIAVNNELENIQGALPQALELLDSGGRLLVISFHSLESAIVGKIYKDFEKRHMGRIITKKSIMPSKEEIRRNPRSKSANLRVFEKN